MTLLARLNEWYRKFERPISSISLIGGFVFDALTLRRVDLFWENTWVGVHLFIVAACIFLINLTENRHARGGKDPERLHFWLISILQWFFGGLLSTFLVYYFRTGTFSVSWPFMLMLALAFVANERLKQHYSRLIFQISLLFLSIFAFAIFIVPVILHSMGPSIFILSGIISLVIIGAFLLMLDFAARETFRKSRWIILSSIAGIFVLVNLLYFYNIIPPLPLALKDAGIYDSLAVNAPGQYTVTAEPQNAWWNFLNAYQPVHIATGTPLFAYTAVFSPAAFNLDVVHEWQHYNDQKNTWVTMGQVTLAVTGGRDGGYRTFSEEAIATAGKWRVNVKTTDGAIIGRVDFEATFTSSTPTLQTTNIN
jgi:MFS family permease